MFSGNLRVNCIDNGSFRGNCKCSFRGNCEDKQVLQVSTRQVSTYSPYNKGHYNNPITNMVYQTTQFITKNIYICTFQQLPSFSFKFQIKPFKSCCNTPTTPILFFKTQHFIKNSCSTSLSLRCLSSTYIISRLYRCLFLNM